MKVKELVEELSKIDGERKVEALYQEGYNKDVALYYDIKTLIIDDDLGVMIVLHNPR